MGKMKSVVFALVALFSVGAMAQGKIAVCDVGAAIFQSDMAQARIKELGAQSNMSSLQAEMEGKRADAEALQKDKEANGMAWNDQQKADYAKNMEYIRADVQLIQRKMQAEQKALQQQIFQEVRPKALEQLDLLIKEEGVDVLLNREAVIWANTATDLTSKLVDRINKAAAAK